MQISYNILNLAQSVSQGGTALATYVYLADGTKAQVWGVQDPLAEQYFAYSPYNYCLNNPVRLVDLDGRKPDEYFNYQGLYLGSDNQPTDFIRIISDNDWEKVKIKNENGMVSYNTDFAKQVSTLFSKADMDTESTLSVYYHYNVTGLPLEDRHKESAGISFNIQEIKGEIVPPRITIPINKNRASGVMDNANNVINNFVHEKQHYDDYKNWGHPKYLDIRRENNGRELEKRAIATQVNHPTYQKTTKDYQDAIIKYWKRQK